MRGELNIELKVHLARDEESGWWYVADSDIPGLVLEADTAAALIEKLEHAAPEMIELNSREIMDRHVSVAERRGATSRPAWSYRPIFDSPLAAHA